MPDLMTVGIVLGSLMLIASTTLLMLGRRLLTKAFSEMEAIEAMSAPEARRRPSRRPIPDPDHDTHEAFPS